MTAYVALLRAVNVGGTGKLPMRDLRTIGERCHFSDVSTFIASGNLIFRSDDSERAVKATLENELHAFTGRPQVALVRSAAALAAVVDTNPFADEAGNRVIVLFLDAPPTADDLVAKHQVDERIQAVGREIFVAYGQGMRESKLDLLASRHATGRNANTVTKLAQLTAALR